MVRVNRVRKRAEYAFHTSVSKSVSIIKDPGEQSWGRAAATPLKPTRRLFKVAASDDHQLEVRVEREFY